MIHAHSGWTMALFAVVFVALTVLFSGGPVRADDSELPPPNAQASPAPEWQTEDFSDPPRLRACCAFGHSLRTKIGMSTVPVRIDNVLSPDQLGRHSYSARNVNAEMNGLIYSCRGGTLDLAHIRDYADWTAYLFVRIREVLGSSAFIVLPDEAGKKKVLMRSFVTDFTEEEKKELAISLAQRIAFELSVWHEIATWYGYSSEELFPERLSAFSPEDIFSNMIGCQVGANAIRSDKTYDAAVDEQIEAEVHKLSPLLPGQTKKTFDMVDGVWWDSAKSMPDTRMVIRRNLDVGRTVSPWIVPDEFSPYCSHRNIPIIKLPVPQTGPRGIVLSELYELRFYVDRSLVPDFDLPDVEREWVTTEDFPFILSRIRVAVKEQFGPYADRSGFTLEELGAVPYAGREYDPEQPCGRDDPDCSFTRREKTQGVQLGKFRAGGGNNPGPLVGGTLAEIRAPGGGFSIFDINSTVNYEKGDYLLHIKSISTDGSLLFCAKRTEDGSDRTKIDWPFVNPFDPKCVGGAVFGIDVSILELVTESKSQRISLRPIEFGVVINALGNGFTPDYLQKHLLISLGLAPESVSKEGYNDEAIRVYSRLIWESLDENSLWGGKVFAQFREDMNEYDDYMGEVGGSISCNLLWNRPGHRKGKTAHSVFSLILEGGVSYWSKPENQMPGMLKFYIPIDPVYNSPNSLDNRLTGTVMLYVETTIPSLWLF